MEALETVDTALFNAVFSYSVSRVCERTFDDLPDKRAEYPFVVLGSTQITETDYKTGALSRVIITISTWGSTDNRAELGQFAQAFLRLKKIRTASYRYIARSDEETAQTLIDTSVPSTQLLHGVITLTYDAYKL